MIPRSRVTSEPVKRSAAQWAWLALVAGCGAGSLPYPVRPADVGTTSDVARSDSGDAADATLIDAPVVDVATTDAAVLDATLMDVSSMDAASGDVTVVDTAAADDSVTDVPSVDTPTVDAASSPDVPGVDTPTVDAASSPDVPGVDAPTVDAASTVDATTADTGSVSDSGLADTGTPPVCGSGTHLCGSSCVSDTAVTSCGSSCTACAVPTGGSATCSGGACGQSCPSGTSLCGGACVALTTTANCGACGRACTSGQTCSGGTCVSSGDAGAGSCPTGMVYIPAGSFVMGDADTLSSQAQPPHMVTLSAYCMDLTEVTVAAYRGCTATGCTAPNTTTYCNLGVTGRDNHPINCVDWSQSRAYCQWRGGDLPTEAQWEYAARGSDAANHIYPWGNASPASQLCWRGDVPTRASTCPVQSYPSGNSPFGLFDMAGNVWEWTRDFYASYTSTAAIDPTGPTSGANRVIRGGSWDYTSATLVRAAYRFGSLPASRGNGVGFRCARGAI